MAGKRQISDETLDKIIEGHGLDMNNRQIADLAGVNKSTVAYWLRNLELPSKVQRGLPPIPVDDTHSLCRKCGEIVLNEDFPFVLGRADGRRLSYCKKCRAKQGREAVGRSPESYFRNKESQIRRNKRGHYFDMTEGFLAGLWYAQEGLCFYTDKPMIMALNNGRDPNGVSIDRIDASRGYVDNNVVLCVDRVNIVKRDVTFEEMEEWMPGWWWRVQNSHPLLLALVVPAPVLDLGATRIEC